MNSKASKFYKCAFLGIKRKLLDFSLEKTNFSMIDLHSSERLAPGSPAERFQPTSGKCAPLDTKASKHEKPMNKDQINPGEVFF